CSVWLGRLFLDNHIFRQGFEALSVWLDHSDGYVTSFAGVDVADGAVFALVCATDDFAASTVFEFAWLFGFHLCYSITCSAA
ncbi:MAG: hypothetical protein WCB20_09585, partial [Chthoniobacterales bacterium]